MARVVTSEWTDWHRQYEPGSPLTKRLEVVRALIREELDRRPPGRLRAISMCAGDGRDLLEVLATHPRRSDVTARLVELDAELAEGARARATRRGLTGIEVVEGDAGLAQTYDGAVPADLLLVCGVYGNVSDSDIRATISHLPELAARGACVVWTRGRFEPDLTPAIRTWFWESGFEEIGFVPVPESTMSAGANRLVAPPRPFDPSVRLFQFLPAGERPADRARARARSVFAPLPPAASGGSRR